MELQQGTLELIELASQTPQTMGSKCVAEYLSKVGECKRTQLSRAMQKKGLDRRGINDALSLLYECELITSRLEGRATVYVWKG